MKDKIICVIIGVVIGLLISGVFFYAYNIKINNEKDNNMEMNDRRGKEMPNGGKESPKIPSDNGEFQPPERPNGELPDHWNQQERNSKDIN